VAGSQHDHAVVRYDHIIACSKNLVDWTVWDGEPLIRPEFAWENVHAHKPWVIKHDGRVYHFYCAVNNKNERYIALAVSE